MMFSNNTPEHTTRKKQHKNIPKQKNEANRSVAVRFRHTPTTRTHIMEEFVLLLMLS